MYFVFDLDETLVSGDIIFQVSKRLFSEGRLDRTFSGLNVTNYDLDGIPKILIDEVKKAYSDPFLACENKMPIKEAFYFLHTLKYFNHKTSILTSRPKQIHNNTCTKIVKDFGNIFSSILFANNSNTILNDKFRPSKISKLQELKPDFYFDDCIEYCNDAASLGIKTYLISNRHTGWNISKSGLHPSVIPIKNVAEFPYQLLVSGETHGI